MKTLAALVLSLFALGTVPASADFTSDVKTASQQAHVKKGKKAKKHHKKHKKHSKKSKKSAKKAAKKKK